MAPQELDFGRLTFLVVEDQEYVRALIVQLLMRLGVERIIEETDGAAGLSRLREETPDIVLCDIRMDPIDGLEFLRRVRGGESGIDPRLPIVFLTSDSEQSTVMTAIQCDVDGYLIKPVSLNDLKNKVIAVLNRHRSADGRQS